MQRYKVIKQLGDGTYGCVWKAVNRSTNELVAIKKMKRHYYSWDECTNLREVKSLQKLNHPNIVKLKEVIRENNNLFLVFEYMECNLYQMMKDRSRLLPVVKIRNWCFQVLQGLAYMHRRGYFHRDLKPENLLMVNYYFWRLIYAYKLVPCTRDMWAMGAIMAELFNLRPIFPGASEADEIFKICSVLGSPNQQTWSRGMKLATLMNFRFPQFAPANLSSVIPSASTEAISLVTALLSWDPDRRPTASESLQHPYFAVGILLPPHVSPKEACDSKKLAPTNYGSERDTEWDNSTKKNRMHVVDNVIRMARYRPFVDTQKIIL